MVPQLGLQRGEKFLAQPVDRLLDAQVARAGDREAGVAAGIDVAKRREVQVDVERQAVVAAAVADAKSERRDLAPSTYTPGASSRPDASTPYWRSKSTTADSSRRTSARTPRFIRRRSSSV